MSNLACSKLKLCSSQPPPPPQPSLSPLMTTPSFFYGAVYLIPHVQTLSHFWRSISQLYLESDHLSPFPPLSRYLIISCLPTGTPVGSSPPTISSQLSCQWFISWFSFHWVNNPQGLCYPFDSPVTPLHPCAYQCPCCFSNTRGPRPP